MICTTCGRVTDHREHLCTVRITVSDLYPDQADTAWFESPAGQADAKEQARQDRGNR
jgi:hypothetical protein